MTELKPKRGFALLSPERRAEIASLGGIAAHAKGVAHEFTPNEARAAGHKGGTEAQRRGTSHRFTSEEAKEAGKRGGIAIAQNRAHMSEIGKKGGAAKGRKRRTYAAAAAEIFPTGGRHEQEG